MVGQVALSPVEAVVMHVVQCMCRRINARTVLWLLAALAVYWIWLRLMGTVDPSETTLYNPDRLHDTLARFMAGGGGVPPSPAHGSARHRTEALCRRMLESMLELELPKCRPKWLVNPTTRRRLELDMYNEAHRLAFEYDGAQHDVYTPHYHVNRDHFEYRRLLDELKTQLCRDAGVTLIRIPWTEVAVGDPVRTARSLERLLRAHHLPHRSVRVAARRDRPGPSQSGRRCPSM